MAATERLQALARQYGVTTNTLVLGAWAILLSRYSRLDDVIFGLTVSGRSARPAGAESMIGPMLSTLPLRVRIPADRPLPTWFGELREQVRTVQASAHAPLGSIHEWSSAPRQLPLFESIVVFETYSTSKVRSAPGAGAQVTGLAVAAPTHYPLTIVVERLPGIAIALDYHASRFEASALERVAEQLGTLLDGIAAGLEAHPSDLSLLTAAERQQLTAWNAPEQRFPANRCLHSLVEEQAERAPEAVAVVCEGKALSHRALNERANQAARHLQALGVGPNVLVGLGVKRSLELAVGLLGILKAGGAYLPLDPRHPPERLAGLVRDAAVTVEQLLLRIWKACWTRAPSGSPTISSISAATLYARFRSSRQSKGRSERSFP
jgi:non-ribosomal peptide synthetase component F